MTALPLINGTRHLEAIALESLAARFGTPLYAYSRAALTANYKAFDEAFAEVEHQVCFAVKANSNIAVLNVLARLGSGFDIVSGGELERVIAAGGEPSKIVFSGLGKTHTEIERALKLGIACFNVESEAELERINSVAARLNVVAPISLRVNPDVDAQTHPYISTGLKENKFGVAIERAPEVYRRAIALGNLEAVGIDCHIGSQLTSTAPFSDALDRVLAMVEQLANEGIVLAHIDIGGGLGVRYKDETPPSPAEYAAVLLPRLKACGLKVYMEPGRAIAANAGVLLTRVEFVKPTEDKHFAIIDAAMNDLIRPALYQAWMDIVPATPRTDVAMQRYDVVGAVCETGDFLGKDRDLSIAAGDLLAISGAGAYGFVMSSNYNTRGRAAEVIVDGDQSWQVRRRETTADLLALESLLP
jgi:diaminopimelate decarboxylase